MLRIKAKKSVISLYLPCASKYKTLHVIALSARTFVAMILLLISLSSYSQTPLTSESSELENNQVLVLDTPESDSVTNSELAIQAESISANEAQINDESTTFQELEQSPSRVSAQLRADLESQFQRIQILEKTEDAYSARLGEEYLSYGLLLQRAGRIEESREKIVDSLHIVKVNEGVYSIEQRPMLRALFENNLALAKTEALVETFDKIVWLENKNPTKIGVYSFDLVLKLGHHFLDRYFIRNTRDNVSLELLDSASRYFSYAIRQYSTQNMNELLMPYGELSEIHFYRSKLVQRLTKQRESSLFRNDRRSNPFDTSRPEKFIENTFSKTEFYAKLHLKKAQDEENQPQIVSGLLALGDANLLFNRKKSAAGYYELAWKESLKLADGHQLRLSLNQPVRLPAFNYALNREAPKRQGAIYAYLPVTVDVDANGKVTKVSENVIGATSQRVASRAKRTVRNSKFRPVIENGEMIATNQHEEKIRVLVSK